MVETFKCLTCRQEFVWANRVNGFCKVCYENRNTSGEKKNTRVAGGVAAELTRQTLRPIRQIMLEQLRKFIKEPGLVEVEPAKIPFGESPSPLSKYLKE